MRRFWAVVVITLGVFVTVALWIGVFAKFTHGVIWYDELKAWQTGLGALFGLLGLGAVAFLNAEMTRRRDDRLRVEEAHGLASALLAEIKDINDTVKNREPAIRARFMEREPLGASIFAMLSLPPDRVFASNCDRLGLLPDDVATATVQFYAAMFVLAKTVGLGEKFDDLFPDEDKAYGNIDYDSAQVTWYGDQAVNILTAFKYDKTRPALKPFTRADYIPLERPAEVPVTGDAKIES